MATISVVMSVYNGGQYLRTAIDSVLQQSYRDFEFIIVNDGSTDDSADIINSYQDKRIKVIWQNNQGLAAALNTGIKAAGGKYIARMDADDICLPQRFEKQVEFLDQHRDHVLLGSNAAVIDRDGNFVYNSDQPCSWEEVQARLPFPPVIHSSVMLNRAAVLAAGMYDEAVSRLNDFEDLLLWNKLIAYGKMANLKEILVRYRLLPTSSTTKIGRLSRLKRELIITAIETGTVDRERSELYLNLKNSLSSRERERLYFKYLAKKYLFVNFQPALARKNLFAAWRIRFTDLQVAAMLCLSFLPAAAVKYVYSLLKSR